MQVFGSQRSMIYWTGISPTIGQNTMMIILQMRLTNKVKGSMLMSITDTLIKEQFEKDRKAKTMNTAKRMIWVTLEKKVSQTSAWHLMILN